MWSKEHRERDLELLPRDWASSLAAPPPAVTLSRLRLFDEICQRKQIICRVWSLLMFFSYKTIRIINGQKYSHHLSVPSAIFTVKQESPRAHLFILLSFILTLSTRAKKNYSAYFEFILYGKHSRIFFIGLEFKRHNVSTTCARLIDYDSYQKYERFEHASTNPRFNS